jgi:hypothetical protein
MIADVDYSVSKLDRSRHWFIPIGFPLCTDRH